MWIPKAWDDPTLEENDAYEMGKRDARAAVEKGEYFDQAMTWDDEGQKGFNEAYDRGANEALKAFVIELYPNARAELDKGRWAINAGIAVRDVWLSDDEHEEAAAWQEAAEDVGRLRGQRRK